jgi:quercetin dioxygenase-like cupin family protein
MALKILGQRLEIAMSSERTGGAYGATEAVIEAGWDGPPPHIHRREDEAVYVLHGALEFVVDGERIEAPQGSFVHIPRGALHSWRNVADGVSRSLTIYTPGGFERIFTAVDAGTPLTELAADYALAIGA